MYQWWLQANGAISDGSVFDSFEPGVWHNVEIVIDRPANSATFVIDGREHTVALDAVWPGVNPSEPMQCIYLFNGGTDSEHPFYMDDTFLRARP